MNERIRELAKEAGIFYYRKGKLQVDMEKFTELIVKECALTAGLMEQEGRKGIGAQLLDNYGIT